MLYLGWSSVSRTITPEATASLRVAANQLKLSDAIRPFSIRWTISISVMDECPI
jgi:hypothetical protein